MRRAALLLCVLAGCGGGAPSWADRVDRICRDVQERFAGYDVPGDVVELGARLPAHIDELRTAADRIREQGGRPRSARSFLSRLDRLERFLVRARAARPKQLAVQAKRFSHVAAEVEFAAEDAGVPRCGSYERFIALADAVTAPLMLSVLGVEGPRTHEAMRRAARAARPGTTSDAQLTVEELADDMRELLGYFRPPVRAAEAVRLYDDVLFDLGFDPALTASGPRAARALRRWVGREGAALRRLLRDLRPPRDVGDPA